MLSAIGGGLVAGQLNAKPTAPRRLEEWFAASERTRKAALKTAPERIAEIDASIHAWVQVHPEVATGKGALSGIPVGVKDIIETEDLATEYGSEIYKGRKGTRDAEIVRQLRAIGAVVMGKTQTCPFACTTPAPTRNPRNLEHTPGGSSSGSAAAVAAGMVPFALGTQTSGSILRPASYCGITGLKPTYGLFSMDGVLPFAHSLDTLGFFTSTPKDMLLLWAAMGRSSGREEDIRLGVVYPPSYVEAAMAEGFQNAIARLRGRGVETETVDITATLESLLKTSNVLFYYEAARFHQKRYEEFGARLLDVADVVKKGLQITDEEYRGAAASIADARDRISRQVERTPVILSPAATGPAPKGLSSTGDSRMNRPWTAIGTPAVAIPMASHAGLPLGMQLTAGHGQEGRLLRSAIRVSGVLGFSWPG